MEKRYLELLANFNNESNNLINETIKTLTDEQWQKQFTGFYKSIRAICSHIYFWDYNTLNRIKLLRKFTCFSDEFNYEKDLDLYTLKISEDGKEYLDEKFISSEGIFKDRSIDEYIEMRRDLDNRIIKLIEEITENDLEKIIKLTTVTGNKFEKGIEGLLIEILIHGIHHRGMVSLYLEMLGKDNDIYSDPCQIFWAFK